jgi:TPR repeat protein
VASSLAATGTVYAIPHDQPQQTQAPGNSNTKSAKQLLEEGIAGHRRLAEAGNAQSQYLLANVYTEEAIAQTVYWLQKAAEQGHPGAQTQLGIFYNSGTGVPKDPAQAMMWWQRAAAQHEFVAQWTLGRKYLRDPATRDLGLKWLRAAADDADKQRPPFVQTLYLDTVSAQVNAQVVLGEFYWQKAKEEAKDPVAARADDAEAQRWLLKAANYKDMAAYHARYDLGLMYLEREQTKENRETAKKWLRSAAEQGHELAQYDLARILERDSPQLQDRAEADKWYRAAAEQGLSEALLKMAERDKGDGVDRLKWWYVYLILCRREKREAECSYSTNAKNVQEMEYAFSPDELKEAQGSATELIKKIIAARRAKFQGL